MRKTKVKTPTFIFDLNFAIGDTIILKTDNEFLSRIIVGIYLDKNGATYRVANGVEESSHYDIEFLSGGAKSEV